MLPVDAPYKQRGDLVGAHYNLYYLLLEDKQKHPLPAQRSEEIQKILEKFCWVIRLRKE